MKPTPLVPALPQRGDGPRWGLAASAVVHGLVILALLGFFVTRRLPPDGSPSPSYDLVFEGPAGGGTPAPTSPAQKLPPAQPADIPPPPDALPGPPAPTPLSTPDPNAATSPPPAAADAGSPPPVPEAVTPPTPTPAPAQRAVSSAQPTPATAAPPRLALAQPAEPASIPIPPPVEAPPTLEQPAVRLVLPPDETAPATSEPIMPQPPPPLVTPQPRPMRQVARPAPRSAPSATIGSLSNPMDLTLGPAAPRPAARGLVASRSLDLSPPRERDGQGSSDPYAQIRAANASADWNRGLLQYWLQHRFYPEQAAANGEQGAVTIQLTVNRSGRVENVEVLTRSGSQWLDMAALATWRDARLPPFTNEMREDRITFPIPIQYFLIRR